MPSAEHYVHKMTRITLVIQPSHRRHFFLINSIPAHSHPVHFGMIIVCACEIEGKVG